MRPVTPSCVANRRGLLGVTPTCALLAAFWAFALPSAAPADDPPKLQDVIKKVKENERLYRNIEMIVDWKQTPLRPMVPSPERPAHVSSRIRVVLAGRKFYFENDSTSDSISKKTLMARTDHSKTAAAFDGKRMRALTISGLRFAEIRSGRNLSWDSPSAWSFPLPNSFLYNGDQYPRPFSRFLEIHDTPGEHYNWFVEGLEELKSLKCVKLKLEYVNPQTGVISGRYEFWLAVNRNDQPVKIRYYSTEWNAKLPIAVGEVTKFMKLKPGVWLPSQTKTVVYDAHALKKGKQVVRFWKSFTVRKAILNPKIEATLFTTLKFPKGIDVVESKDGEVVRKYRQP